MHIPDGFVNAPVALGAGALATGALALSVRRVGKVLPESRTALLGVSAAFIFAAQMVNFPVAGGTSGHLIGGALAAILLGPIAAVIAMSAVVLLQCFIFADGGVTALGCNAFNMAVLAPMTGYVVYRAAMPLTRGRLSLATGLAGWCSTMVAALSCAGQIALSGKAAPGLIFPAMVGVHALIGIGEGFITAMVIVALARTRPDMLSPIARPQTAGSTWSVVIFGSIVALGLAMFVAPFASTAPDGLEQVGEMLGFHAPKPVVPAIAPNYAVPGIASEGISTAVAGAAGTILALGLVLLVARFFYRGQAEPATVKNTRA